jgi:hypothetical protein
MMISELREHAAKHASAHPAYHKHCHLHPDDVCPDCAWYLELLAILDRWQCLWRPAMSDDA